ncbi:MAG TPA: histidine phosphatase family protein [Gaiellaceae bacterium]
MALLVVRHARAGKRKAWQGDDRQRPLDRRGWRQAEGLPGLLASYAVERIVSSGYLRCVQTVEPLAQARGLSVETRPEAEEAASREEALGLLVELGDRAAVSTHGDVLERLFGVDGQKGSTRVVELRDGEPVVLAYLPPPA